MSDYDDLRGDIKILKHDAENVNASIKELVLAIKENTKEQHNLSLSFKDISAKNLSVESSCKRAHERIDEYDGFKNKLFLGVFSAIGMAILGLVMKFGGN